MIPWKLLTCRTLHIMRDGKYYLHDELFSHGEKRIEMAGCSLLICTTQQQSCVEDNY